MVVLMQLPNRTVVNFMGAQFSLKILKAKSRNCLPVSKLVWLSCVTTWSSSYVSLTRAFHVTEFNNVFNTNMNVDVLLNIIISYSPTTNILSCSKSV